MTLPATTSKTREGMMGYSPVSNEEVLDEFNYPNVTTNRFLVTTGGWTGRTLIVLNMLLFVTSIAVFVKSTSRQLQQNRALEEVSYFSPLFDRLDIPFVEKVVQGDLFNEHNLLLRQYPSSEVDEAWEALTDVGVVLITREEILRLGKNPKTSVKAPPEWGHGEEAYLAQPDGQHALHCLNAVRKYAYREHYYPAQTTCPITSHAANLTSTSPLQPFHQAHLSHCLHVLLQTLSCDFSTDMITHNWMETQEYPFPDFAINKKCKDHSKILEWQTKDRITSEMWMEMSMRGPQPGDTVLQLPPMLKAWSQSDVVGGQAKKDN